MDLIQLLKRREKSGRVFKDRMKVWIYVMKFMKKIARGGRSDVVKGSTDRTRTNRIL